MDLLAPLFPRLLAAAESGRLPDALVRAGIRRLLAARLRDMERLSCEETQEEIESFLADCRAAPIACVPELANEQHYEVPAEFFRRALGPRMKYSCCHWNERATTLAEAEESALDITCRRAGVRDGESVLDLGCGWGSLSLWIAERYPECRVVAVSNSRGQREFIESRAAERGFVRLRVVTADINEFDTDERFDHAVSIEMFEHLRNHPRLLERVSRWLVPGGTLFAHLFTHRARPYLFEDHGPQDWMSRHFFSGGMMPHDGLLARCQDHLTLEREWRWSGLHYERTCDAWLARVDADRDAVLASLRPTYGDASKLWFQRWRIFFMACAELFGFRGGEEWRVTHALFRNPGGASQ